MLPHFSKTSQGRMKKAIRDPDGLVHLRMGRHVSVRRPRWICRARQVPQVP